MDEDFKIFYSKLDKGKFKYFTNGNVYNVYGSDILLLPPENQTKDGSSVVRLSEIEGIVKQMLMIKKIPVEEYTDGNLSRSGFPSDYGDFMDICISDKIPPTLCALKIVKNASKQGNASKKAISFGYVDNYKIHTTEYVDDDLYTVTYSLVGQFNCTEMLYEEDSFERILLGWGLSSVKFKADSVHEMLKNYLKKNLPVEVFQRSNCCIVNIKDFDLPDFGCETAQGRRLLDQWLRAPLVVEQDINKRLDLTEAFCNIRFDLRSFGDLKRLVLKITGGKVNVNECIRLYQLIYEIPKFVSSFEEFVDERNARRGDSYESHKNHDSMKENSSFNESSLTAIQYDQSKDNLKRSDYNQRVCGYIVEDFINPLKTVFEILQPMLDKIREEIDFEKGRISTSLSERLSILESKKLEVLKDVEREFIKVRNKFPRLKFSNRAFKISRNDYNDTDFEGTGFLVLSVLKTGVSFTSKTMNELKEKVEKIENEIEIEEKEILQDLKTFLSGFVNSIEIYNYITAMMDIFKCFSKRVGIYSRPIFCNDPCRIALSAQDKIPAESSSNNRNLRDDYEKENYFKDEQTSSIGEKFLKYTDDTAIGSCKIEKTYCVEGLFHPLLENKDCVLNDISFTKNVCVLTGPNMGGKSTFLRSLSILSLLAQVGCYVPAKKAIIPIFDSIFLRVGARDCSSLGLSTFMVEMIDLAKIVRGATRESLVLIDELGRGTSAVDGLSLVMALRQYLIQLGAFSVMATHFSELCHKETLNKKMGVSEGLVTYKVVDGVCDSSFALDAAIRANFPASVIESIKKQLDE